MKSYFTLFVFYTVPLFFRYTKLFKRSLSCCKLQYFLNENNTYVILLYIYILVFYILLIYVIFLIMRSAFIGSMYDWKVDI